MSSATLGIVETKGLVTAIEAANLMVKTANVDLVKQEISGEGIVTLFIKGELIDVKIAIETAITEVKQGYKLISKFIIPTPHDDIEDLLNDKFDYIFNFKADLGLIETKGLLGAIAAADSMLKTADIKIVRLEHAPGASPVLYIEGEITHIKAALEAGAESSKKLGQFLKIYSVQKPDKKIDLLINLPDTKKDPKKIKKGIKEAEDQKNNDKSDQISLFEKIDNSFEEKKSTYHDVNGKKTISETLLIEAPDKKSDEKIQSFIDEKLNLAETKDKEIETTLPVESKDIKAEELENLSVSQLRKLARDVENFPIKGRTISMANKNVLLEHFKQLGVS